MIPLTLEQIAKIVGGRVHAGAGNAVVTGAVEFDSRKVGAGDLFIALPGERVDGHDFAAQTIAAGAVGVLAAREVDVPAVIVPAVVRGSGRAYVLAGDRDGSGAAVLAALGKLARYVVDVLSASGLVVVGVTGSAGKTSTKDLIGQLLTPMGPTISPPGSFNNELGHPWTALGANKQTRHLVLELSARGPGHIAALCEVAPPRIGAVLNVGTAHLGEFGSRNEIARAKGELVAALPNAENGGVAVLNIDDPLVAAMADRTTAKIVRIGQSANADVRAIAVTCDEAARASFRLRVAGDEADVRLALHGAHQVNNALTAAAIALELGATVAEVAARLSLAEPLSARRMQVVTRDDEVTIINDTYNASPEAVRAALEATAAMAHATSPPRRCWAVLGPMLELGANSSNIHEELGKLAIHLGIDRLVAVGEAAAFFSSGAKRESALRSESTVVPDTDAALALLRSELKPRDIVLVKAAQAAKLWRIAEGLLADVSHSTQTSVGGVR